MTQETVVCRRKSPLVVIVFLFCLGGFHLFEEGLGLPLCHDRLSEHHLHSESRIFVEGVLFPYIMPPTHDLHPVGILAAQSSSEGEGQFLAQFFPAHSDI